MMKLSMSTYRDLTKVLGYLNKLQNINYVLQSKMDQVEDILILEEESVTQQELSTLLGINISTLINWRRQGCLPYSKTGRLYFYNGSAVIKALKLHYPEKYYRVKPYSTR